MTPRERQALTLEKGGYARIVPTMAPWRVKLRLDLIDTCLRIQGHGRADVAPRTESCAAQNRKIWELTYS